MTTDPIALILISTVAASLVVMLLMVLTDRD